MSAPSTNVETQEKHHRVPLFGMATGVIVALFLLLGSIAYLAAVGGAPEGADRQIDSRTGAIVDS